tara:strand:- start:588 stop:809 length:222 start_codon:yes stop_codon:yes gene_type:complete
MKTKKEPIVRLFEIIRKIDKSNKGYVMGLDLNRWMFGRKMKCCWNEEKKEYYETESIGLNKFRCLGCYKEIEE